MSHGRAPSADGAVEAARAAQPAWAATSLRARLRAIRHARHEIAARAGQLVAAVETARPRPPGETLGAEVVPLAEACRFLERRAREILAPRRLRPRFSLLWTGGIGVEVRREPHGVVLIIGPSNYPLFLIAVQALQALTAGNAVVVKPGRGGLPAATAFAEALRAAGMDERLCHVLPEAPEAAAATIRAGVDKVVLTGSAAAGQAILAELAPRLVPATMELSGCDAVFVQRDADLALVVAALRFGLRLNDGQTCISPRRVFVDRSLAEALESRLADMAADFPTCRADPASAALARELAREAVAQGARLVAGNLDDDAPFAPIIVADASPEMRLLQADIFAPVLSVVGVCDDAEALAAAARCPYALGASVFGKRAAARQLAARVRAGTVVVNDLIAPTADPRVPFGGRGRSGFGVTRGAEGLLEMTTPKAVVTPRGWWRLHLREPGPQNERVLAAWMAAAHGRSRWARLRAWLGVLRAASKGRTTP